MCGKHTKDTKKAEEPPADAPTSPRHGSKHSQLDACGPRPSDMHSNMWNPWAPPFPVAAHHCVTCFYLHPYGQPCYSAQYRPYAHDPRQHGPDVALGNYQYPPGYQGHWPRPDDYVRAPPNAYYPTHQGRPMYPPIHGPGYPAAHPPGQYPGLVQPRGGPPASNTYLYNKHEAELAYENEQRAIKGKTYDPVPFAPADPKPDQEFECRNPSGQRIFMTYATIKNAFPDGEWRQAPNGQLVFYMNRFHGQMPEIEGDQSD